MRSQFCISDEPSRFILVPWNAAESMTIHAAAKYLDQSEANVRRLVARYDLGRRVAGSWCVSRVALTMFAEGDARALRLYHEGNRSSDEVLGYFRRHGISIPLSGAAA